MEKYKVSADVSKKKRNLLAFFLFISLAVFSLSVCGRSVIFNADAFIDMFTDGNYVVELQRDVTRYGKDLCKKASLPDDFIDDVIRYNTILELENSYVNTKLADSDEYNEYAYGVLLEQLETDIANEAGQMVEASGLRIDSKQVSGGAEKFARNITDYLQKRIEFPYMDELCDVTYRGERICTALAVFSFLVAACLIFCIIRLEGKLYRRLRGIAVSVVSAFVFDLIMLLAVTIVRITKDLVIYPGYLANAFMSYVDRSMLTVGISSILFMLIALALMASIWAMKRYEKE